MSVHTITHHNITFDSEKLEKLCRRKGIKKLSLFGSVLHDDFGPNSDIDMLVEFLPGEAVTYIDIAGYETELTALFGGRKIDLRTPAELSKYFRDKVLAEAETLYVYR